MSWTCLREKTVIAKKEHRCFMCMETIEKGDKYVRRVGVDDEMLTMKMHPECENASIGWGIDDWESFREGDLKRPKGDRHG